jgi:hypothetical protein
MVYAYGFSDGNITAAVAEYQRHFPNRRIPDRRVFSSVLQKLRESSSFRGVCISFDRLMQQDFAEQENIIQMVQRSLGVSRRRISTRLRVSQTRVRRTLQEEGTYP